MQRRLSILPSALRPFTREYHDLPQTLVLTGPRGVGKTTFLLHHATGKRFLYLSMDNPSLANFPLYDLVRAIFLEGYEGVIIDEVHFAANWSLHLKALSDDFPRHSIWASDSFCPDFDAASLLSRIPCPRNRPELSSLRPFLAKCFLAPGSYTRASCGISALQAKRHSSILCTVGI